MRRTPWPDRTLPINACMWSIRSSCDFHAQSLPAHGAVVLWLHAHLQTNICMRTVCLPHTFEHGCMRLGVRPLAPPVSNPSAARRSNALVVGGFYGPAHSREWWLGAVLSTAIPVIYAFTGGMRASIMTDASQVWRTACSLQVC